MSSKQSRARKKADVSSPKAGPSAPSGPASQAAPTVQKAPAPQAGPGKQKQSLASIAEALLNPKGKNPYYFNGKPLANLQELADYMPAFTGEEGHWVASWIEYLGDRDTAERIRQNPRDFKRIVRDRCDELKKSRGQVAMPYPDDLEDCGD